MLKFAKFLIILSVALVASTSVFAADQSVVPKQGRTTAPKPLCDGYCQRYKAAHPAPLRHVNFELACINFVQGTKDNVVITVFGPGGSVLYDKAKTKPKQASLCFARSLLQYASGIMLCDGPNTAIISETWMTTLREQGGMTKTQYACLLGKACKNYRGQRPQFAKAR